LKISGEANAPNAPPVVRLLKALRTFVASILTPHVMLVITAGTKLKMEFSKGKYILEIFSNCLALCQNPCA